MNDREKLPSTNSHNPLNMFTRGHVRGNANGRKTYQGDDVPQRAPTKKFARPLNDVIIKIYISTITRLMPSKLDSVLVYERSSGADPALQTEFVEFLVQFRYLEKKIII